MKETDLKILNMAADGLTAKEIGADMKMSRRTIEARIAKMKKKYDCRSTAHLVKRILILQESA